MGIELRDYFAAHAPMPRESDIFVQQERDRARNPHNDTYKPRIRSRMEIMAEMAYEYADTMMEIRELNKRDTY